MAFTDDNGNKTEYEGIGAGNFPSRVVHLIDLGKQHMQGYNKSTKKWFPLYYVVDENGKTVKNDEGYAKKSGEVNDHPVIQNQYRVTFEFPTKTREFNGEQKPKWVKKDYGFVGLEKLAKAIANGVITDLPGKPCFTTLGVTTGGYDKVMSVSPPVDGVDIAELDNPAVLFDFDAPIKEQWDNIPSWYVDDIKKATNYEGSALQAMVEGSSEPNNQQESAQDDRGDPERPY